MAKYSITTKAGQPNCKSHFQTRTNCVAYSISAGAHTLVEMTHRGHRETILLIILHVWILPSYGFTLVPHYANTFGHVATAHTTCISTLAAVTRTRSFSGVMKTKSQLKMSDDRRASYERFEDDYPSGSNDEQVCRSSVRTCFLDVKLNTGLSCCRIGQTGWRADRPFIS